jgi:hypothetical protein
VVQALVIRPHVENFRCERWQTPDGKMMMVPVPAAIDGHFGRNCVASRTPNTIRGKSPTRRRCRCCRRSASSSPNASMSVPTSRKAERGLRKLKMMLGRKSVQVPEPLIRSSPSRKRSEMSQCSLGCSRQTNVRSALRSTPARVPAKSFGGRQTNERAQRFRPNRNGAS